MTLGTEIVILLYIFVKSCSLSNESGRFIGVISILTGIAALAVIMVQMLVVITAVLLSIQVGLI